MPPPLILRLHPNDVSGAARLIATAIAAVAPTGGAVAAWDASHLTRRPFWAERAIAQIFEAVERTLSTPGRCFGFMATPHAVEPGLVPRVIEVDPKLQLRFAPALEALVDTLHAHPGFGLIVSNGFQPTREVESLTFHPGILHLHPALDEGYSKDPFVAAGFPTVLITPQAAPPSAHELLDQCSQLAGRMAEDAQRLRVRPGA